jgi:AraC-like DNA-binding protein
MVTKVDIIGDIVAAMKAGTPLARRTELHGRWGLRVAGDAGAGFHVVLEGAAWMLPPLSPVPLKLGAGDLVFAANGDGYALADHPDTPLEDVAPSAPKETWPVPQPIVGQPPSAVLLCGSYTLERARPHPLIAQLPAVIHVPAGTAEGESLRPVLELLGAEVPRDEPGFSAAVPALLDLLLVYVLRAWYARQADRGLPGWAQALRDPAIARALNQIQRWPAKPWTVADLATEVAMSRSAFARQFSRLVGESPVAYLTRWRMMLSARLLRETDLSLDTIAVRVGYGSAFAFSKAFSRTWGSPPDRYRRGETVTLSPE